MRLTEHVIRRWPAEYNVESEVGVKFRFLRKMRGERSALTVDGGVDKADRLVEQRSTIIDQLAIEHGYHWRNPNAGRDQHDRAPGRFIEYKRATGRESFYGIANPNVVVQPVRNAVLSLALNTDPISTAVRRVG